MRIITLKKDSVEALQQSVFAHTTNGWTPDGVAFEENGKHKQVMKITEAQWKNNNKFREDVPTDVRIRNAGIKMIGKYPDDEMQYLEYEGKLVERPKNASNAVAFCLAEFGLDI